MSEARNAQENLEKEISEQEKVQRLKKEMETLEKYMLFNLAGQDLSILTEPGKYRKIFVCVFTPKGENMRIFIIFMAILFSSSFSYADVATERVDETSGIILKTASEPETASDKPMYAKSKSSSQKTKSSKSSIRSKSSTRSSKKKKPYLLKDGCKFTLYTNAGDVTVKSKTSGASPMILEKSGIRIVIQNCKVIENLMNIPVRTQNKWWKFW